MVKGGYLQSNVPGVANIADKASRKFDNEKEWKLDSRIFIMLNSLVCQSIDIDLFATRSNHLFHGNQIQNVFS